MIAQGEIFEIINILKDIDRYTPGSRFPKNIINLHKEVFKYKNYVIKKTNYKKNQNVDHYLFENEALWLDKLQKYDFVPRFYGKYVEGKDIILVMEYIKGKTLNNISCFEKLFLDVNVINNQFIEILDVFQEEGITHKDLRPQNIILTKDGMIKIIDFQFCSKLGEDIKTNNDIQLMHYNRAISNVGGRYRKPGLNSHNFETDKYALDLIIKEIKQLKYLRINKKSNV